MPLLIHTHLYKSKVWDHWVDRVPDPLSLSTISSFYFFSSSTESTSGSAASCHGNLLLLLLFPLLVAQLVDLPQLPK